MAILGICNHNVGSYSAPTEFRMLAEHAVGAAQKRGPNRQQKQDVSQDVCSPTFRRALQHKVASFML